MLINTFIPYLALVCTTLAGMLMSSAIWAEGGDERPLVCGIAIGTLGVIAPMSLTLAYVLFMVYMYRTSKVHIDRAGNYQYPFSSIQVRPVGVILYLIGSTIISLAM